MAWDFEIQQRKNSSLPDIEVGSLYKLSIYKSKRHVLIVPLKMLTYNIHTGDTELLAIVEDKIKTLPGWMLGNKHEMLQKVY
jgi:hypothetical protein